MSELPPQFELLITYADGLADATQQEEAEKLIATDEEAAAFYTSLQKTQLPNADIFVGQLEPVPESMIATINETDLAPTAYSSLTPKKFGGLALVASLFLGLISGAILYGTGTSFKKYNPAQDTAEAEMPEWVRLVADYHRLYVRETITASAPLSAELVAQQVSKELKEPIGVPLLDGLGMEFRRAQWLAIDGRPLLQLAYLPDKGKPLAVCVLKKNSSEEIPLEFGETGGMQYGHWQTGTHAIIVVGSLSGEELRDIIDVVERELIL